MKVLLPLKNPEAGIWQRIRKILLSLDYTMIRTMPGESFADGIKRVSPDVVITEWKKDETLENVEKIRSNEQYHSISLLVAVDEASNPEIAKMIESGVDDCFHLNTPDLLIKARLNSFSILSKAVSAEKEKPATALKPLRAAPAMPLMRRIEAPRPFRILVIDDDMSILILVSNILTEAGYIVEVANRGVEGIMRYRRARPDLIILDINMPDIDGFEVSERIKNPKDMSQFKTINEKIKKLSEAVVPILFLTVKASTEDVIRAAQAGANGYLVKPFKQEELLEKVNKMIVPFPL